MEDIQYVYRREYFFHLWNQYLNRTNEGASKKNKLGHKDMIEIVNTEN